MADHRDPLTGPGHPGAFGAARTRSRGILLGAAVVLGAGCFGEGPPIGPGPVVSVRVSPDTLILAAGETGTLSAIPLDASVALVAAGAVTWSSAAPSVATVDEMGRVSAQALGAATVTASVAGQEGSAVVLVSAPAIALSTSSASFHATAGGPAPANQTLAVTNGGPGSLTGLSVGGITYGPGAQGWLSATVAPDSAPATLTLQATTDALPPGTYDAEVAVTSPVAGNTPQTVDVTFTVGAPPAGTPGRLAIVTEPGGATANAVFSRQPVIEIRDSAGARVFGATNQVTAVVTAGDGSLVGTTTVAAVDGQVVFTDLAIRGPQTAGDTIGFGDHQLQFTSGGLASATSASFNVEVSFVYNVRYLFGESLGFVSCLACHATYDTPGALVNQAAVENPGCGTLVVPGSPGSSLLMQKLDDSQVGGCGLVMPTNGALSAALRDLVRRWINEGAKDN